jgi:hypothetical protein
VSYTHGVALTLQKCVRRSVATSSVTTLVLYGRPMPHGCGRLVVMEPAAWGRAPAPAAAAGVRGSGGSAVDRALDRGSGTEERHDGCAQAAVAAAGETYGCA